MTPNVMDSISAKSQKALNHEHDTARPGRSKPNNLRDQVAVDEGLRLWPTPTSTERSGINPNTGRGSGLSKSVKAWPTPTSRDYKDGDAHSTQNVPVNGLLGRAIHTTRAWGTPRTQMTRNTPVDRNKSNLEEQVDGKLNPDWVEWLMGVPIGWTALEPLERTDYDQWFDAMNTHTWWREEPPIPRVTTGMPDRINRLKALGNGIVPAGAAMFLAMKMHWAW